MATPIDHIAKRLNTLITENKADLVVRLGASDCDERPNAERTLSNTSLLLDSLATFYGDPKSEFFPTSITTSLHGQLIQIESILAGLPVETQEIPADSATTLLGQLDNLFAYCLQYGLLTFGFTSKVAQEQLEQIRLARQQTDSSAKKMLISLRNRELEIENKLNEFDELLALRETNFNEIAGTRLDALQPSIDKITALLESGASNLTEIQTVLNTAVEIGNSIEKTRAEFDINTAVINERLNASKASAEAELNAIQNRSNQIQTFESEAKVMHQAITDARAKMTDQLAQITAFYSDIEAYRQQMIDAGKNAQAHLADLRSKSDNSVTALKERTDEVVKTNESLIKQIKDHLRKAIGASLFTAFDTRRSQITTASWVWAGLLLASVIGTIVFAFWFVSEVAKLSETAAVAKTNYGTPTNIQWMLLYTRLVIVAPLAFLVTFTAKRYTSERRAEEEWAFKSAISISLDPFRDLIARMKVDGQETAFVERLISEIFDNPTKRLYATVSTKDEKDTPDVLSLTKDLLDKIPKAKI